MVALIAWKTIFYPTNSFRSSRSKAFLWLLIMFACTCAVYFVLLKWSSPSVRDDIAEVSFYLVFSIGWIGFAQATLAFLGISLRDDVAERGNGSAGFAVGGLTVAVTCCVAGANVGDGPGFEVVLFCAALATTTLFLLWILVAQSSSAAEAITVERDLGTGIRIGGWFAGTGIVLGACVAGDWISLAATLRDFAKYSWPVIVFAGGFAIFERTAIHTTSRNQPSVAVSAVTAMAMTAAGGGCTQDGSAAIDDRSTHSRCESFAARLEQAAVASHFRPV